MSSTAPLRFRLADGLSSVAAANALIEAYEMIATWPDKVRRTAAAVERDAADPRCASLAVAARSIAAMIDADPPRFDRPDYHSRQHFCEVVLAVSVLADLHRLADADAQLLVLAALSHDVVHDGQTGSRFRLERASADHVRHLLVAANVDPTDVARLTVMVIATEPVDGVRCALGAHRFHVDGTVPPTVPDAAPELAALLVDARLAQLTALLCEADVLPSIGLSFAYGLRVQHRLAREWGRRLAAPHKLAFVDHVLAHGVIGPFFAPNAAAVRIELARLVDAPDEG